MILKRILLLLLTLTSLPASAALLNCGDSKVKRIMIQSDREGTHGHENTLLVALSDANTGQDIHCSGKNYVYIDNNDPSYSGMVSVLLAAQISDKPVQVFVNTTVITGGNAVQIAFISMSK